MKRKANLVDELTQRERDVLRGLSMGLTNAEIAEYYTLSRTTVKWYTRQIYSKLQLDHEIDKRKIAATIGEKAGLVAAVAPGSDLPVDVTPFIGRSDEINTLSNLLRAPFPRLITIVGLGGSGKTRLAIKVVREVAPDFNGRIHFIRLQNAHTRDDLLGTVARTIGCTTHNTQKWIKTIASQLGDEQTLLLLDNTEQLVENAAVLVELLEAVPELRLLATSRRQLGLNCEGVFPLTGLAYPSEEDTDNDPLSFDAVIYFVKMAQQVNLRWQPNADDLQHITRICKLVNGLPLALNIAARWFPRLSLETIANVVAAGSERLVTEFPDILPRQHSIEAILRWTSDQLSAEQLKIFACLGLFNSDFALDAAESIVGMTEKELRTFIQLGIVDVDHAERFKLHPLVKQYTLQQLKTSEHYAETKRRFVRYYASLAKTLSVRMIRDTVALGVFEREWAHMQAAWNYTLDIEDWDSLHDLLEPMHHFAWRRVYFREALILYRAAREALPPSCMLLSAKVEVYAIHLATWSAPIAQFMIDHLQNQIVILKAHHNRESQAFGLVVLSLILRTSGQVEASYDAARQALAIYQTCDDAWGMILTHYQVGLALDQLNDVQGAFNHWQQCQEINTTVGDDMLASMVLHRMAAVKWRSGDSIQALKLLDSAREIIKSMGDRDMNGGVAQLTSLVHFSRGEFDAAAQHREQSLQYYRWVQNDRTVRYLLTQNVYTALVRDNLSEAHAAMKEIGADLSEPYIATCADHLRYASDKILPDPNEVLNRVEQLHRYHLHMEIILSLALITATLAEQENYQKLILLGTSLTQASACPTWFLKLPVIQSSLYSAKQRLGNRQFQALWHKGSKSPSAWLYLLPDLGIV